MKKLLIATTLFIAGLLLHLAPSASEGLWQLISAVLITGGIYYLYVFLKNR